MLIIPIHNSRRYNFWRITTPYLSFPLNNLIESDEDIEYETGFRLTTIITTWITIESFVRAALYEKGHVSINRISQRPEYQPKLSCISKIKNLFKSKKRKNEESVERYNTVKREFLEEIEKGVWRDLKDISETIDLPIKQGIGDESWQFLVHLYNLRNAFVHGNALEFGRSNFKELGINDKVSTKFKKALKYFDKGRSGSKIINFDKLLETQDISMILNKRVTDVIIERMVIAIDELANLYSETNTSIDWQKMREMDNR